MITDLPPVDAAQLPVLDWRPGDTAPRGTGRGDVVRVRCLGCDAAAFAAALRPGGPRVRLEVTGDLPAEPVDVAALVAGGVVECRVDTAGLRDAADWVRFVAVLVAAREHGLAVEWTSTPTRPPWVCARLLHHLPPPDTDTDTDTDTDNGDGDGDGDGAWAAAHRFGTLYWRRGPGFVSVVDARTDETARYLIDDPGLVELFGRLERPLATGSLDPAQLDQLDELVEAELVVVDGGLALRLPYRLRHRPMPGHRI